MSNTNSSHDNIDNQPTDPSANQPAVAGEVQAAQEAPKRQVIAMGSGGFGHNFNWPIHDDYILKATGKDVPRILYIGAAGGDNSGGHFFKAFKRFPCIPSVLPLFSPEAHYKSLEDMYAHVLNQDVIYCGGGQSFTLVAILKAWGLQPIIKQAYEQGTVLAGLSAGANVWFNRALSDYNPGTLSPLEALDILPWSFSPHHNLDRDQAFKHYLREGAIPNGYGAEDGVGIHFVNEQATVAVCEWKGQKGTSYTLRKNGQIGKENLPTLVHNISDERVQECNAWAEKVLAREREEEERRRLRDLVSIRRR